MKKRERKTKKEKKRERGKAKPFKISGVAFYILEYIITYIIYHDIT